MCESKANKVASNAHLAEGSNIEKSKKNAATDEGNLVLRSPEAAGLGCLSEKRVKAEKLGHDTSDGAQKSAKAEVAPLLFAEKDSIARTPIKKEVHVLINGFSSCALMLSLLSNLILDYDQVFHWHILNIMKESHLMDFYKCLRNTNLYSYVKN